MAPTETATEDEMESTYKVLSVNDTKDFCECCGKTGLSRVVWIENIETGEVKHFGTTCASAPAKGFGVEKEIKSAIYSFAAKQKSVLTVAHKIYRRVGGTYTEVSRCDWRVNDSALMDKCISDAKAVLFN